MSEVAYLRGNQAAAIAAKMSRIDFMGAYPIPPSSEIMEAISTMIDRGELKAGFLEADGERSASFACFAAAAAGGRAFNATSSQGLALMNETLHLQSGSRVPMVLVVGLRSLFAPHSMKCDHTDMMSARDTGWLQFFCETVQETFDTIIMAFKIGEDPKVKLPVMVGEDGYYTTHSLERVVLPTQEEVDAFLPRYEPAIDDHIEPKGISMFTSFGVMENWFTEFRYQQRMALERAEDIIEQVDKDFGAAFGRSYGGLVDAYMCEDADVILVAMASICGTARFAIDVMRSAGKKVGLLKIKTYRPFPYKKIQKVMSSSSAKAVVVLDRFNENALRDEMRSALYPLDKKPLVLGFIVGLNGRDVSYYNMIDLAEQGFAAIKKGKVDNEQVTYMVRSKALQEA